VFKLSFFVCLFPKVRVTVLKEFVGAYSSSSVRWHPGRRPPAKCLGGLELEAQTNGINHRNITSKVPVVGKPSPPYRNGTFSMLEV
jgi:hypothetical protein